MDVRLGDSGPVAVPKPMFYIHVIACTIYNALHYIYIVVHAANNRRNTGDVYYIYFTTVAEHLRGTILRKILLPKTSFHSNLSLFTITWIQKVIISLETTVVNFFGYIHIPAKRKYAFNIHPICFLSFCAKQRILVRGS